MSTKIQDYQINLPSISGYIQNVAVNVFTGSAAFYPSSNPSGFISDTGQFYPSNNPSGYITSVGTGNFITNSQTGQFLDLNSGLFLQNQIISISGQTGNLTGQFYPLNQNPSNYLTGFNSGLYVQTGQTGQFASQINLFNSGQNLQSQITYLNLGTGSVNFTSSGQAILSGFRAINTFYINYSGTGNYTGDMILQSSGNLQINRLNINLSGLQTINVYNQSLNANNLIFYYTGDSTTTQIYLETSYSGIWNLDDANFIG